MNEPATHLQSHRRGGTHAVPKRTVVRWLDPEWHLTLMPLFFVFGAPAMLLEPWMPWRLLFAVMLVGCSCGWRVVVGPRGVSIARTVFGIPIRFHSLGPSVGFTFDDGFETGSAAIEVHARCFPFNMGAWRRPVSEDAYARIIEALECAALETAPLFPSSPLRRVFQPRSTPVTF